MMTPKARRCWLQMANAHGNLFREIVISMPDTGMRNQRELYQMRIENRDWETPDLPSR